MDKRPLRSMEIEPAENGGHTVTHRFKSTPNPSTKGSIAEIYHEPETHVFGEGQEKELMAHVANKLGIKAGK